MLLKRSTAPFWWNTRLCKSRERKHEIKNKNVRPQLMRRVIQKMSLLLIQQEFVRCLISHMPPCIHWKITSSTFWNLFVSLQNEWMNRSPSLFFVGLFVCTDYHVFSTDTVYIEVYSHPQRKPKRTQNLPPNTNLSLIVLNCGAKPAFSRA